MFWWKSDPDVVVFVTHCDFYGSSCYCLHPSHCCCVSCFHFYRSYITHNTAQHWLSLSRSLSSTLTFINIPLVSLGASLRSREKAALLLLLLLLSSQTLIFTVTKHAFFLAQKWEEKLISVDHCRWTRSGDGHPRCWLDSFSALIVAHIPDSLSQCDVINDSHRVPAYRLQAHKHQSDATEGGQTLMRVRFPSTYCAAKVSPHWRTCCGRKWHERPDWGQWGQRLHLAVQTRVGHRLWPGSRPATLHRVPIGVWESDRATGWTARGLIHHSPEWGQNQSGQTFRSVAAKSPSAVRW